MAATVSQIRTAAAAVLTAGLSGWNVTKRWKPSPNPDQIDMMPGEIHYHQAMAGGYNDVPLIIRATVRSGDLEASAQDKLDALTEATGTASLLAVLEADRTLGGTISSLSVDSVSEYKAFGTQGGSDLIGVEFTVRVIP